MLLSELQLLLQPRVFQQLLDLDMGTWESRSHTAATLDFKFLGLSNTKTKAARWRLGQDFQNLLNIGKQTDQHGLTLAYYEASFNFPVVIKCSDTDDAVALQTSIANALQSFRSATDHPVVISVFRRSRYKKRLVRDFAHSVLAKQATL